MHKETNYDDTAKRLISFVESGEHSTELSVPTQRPKSKTITADIPSFILDVYGKPLKITKSHTLVKDENNLEASYNPRDQLCESALRLKLLHYYFETVTQEFPQGTYELFAFNNNQNSYKTITLADLSHGLFYDICHSTHFSVDVIRHFDEYNDTLKNRTYNDSLGVPRILNHMSITSLKMFFILVTRLQEGSNFVTNKNLDTPLMTLVKAELEKRTVKHFFKEISKGFKEGFFNGFSTAKIVLKFPFTLPSRIRQITKKADTHE